MSHWKLLQNPIVQWSMVLELERAKGVRNTCDGLRRLAKPG